MFFDIDFLNVNETIFLKLFQALNKIDIDLNKILFHLQFPNIF